MRGQTEFPATQVIAELEAQERDIVLLAIAVREALECRIYYFHVCLEYDREYYAKELTKSPGNKKPQPS
eukprot:scaffold2160_cov55-Cylindrotheca_fusiformis.AAC.1